MPLLTVVTVEDIDGNACECVYYPMWFGRFTVSWKRLLAKDRIEEFFVCVDGVRGVAQRADTIPSSSRLEVPEDAVVPAAIDRESALSKAGDLARLWSRSRMFSFWQPVLETVEFNLLHVAYVIEQTPDGTILKDLLTGDSRRL